MYLMSVRMFHTPVAGPPGGAGSQHGMPVPVWLIVAAVVTIVIVGVVGILRRRR
jgi:hypothetical protein